MHEYDLKADEELLLLLKSNDENAFEAVYRRYWEGLFTKAYHLLHDRSLAEDVVQEVYLDIWRRRSDIKVQRLEAYLHQATRFICYRKLSNMPRQTPFFAELEGALTSSFFADDQVIRKELQTLLNLWIAALSPRKRKIFVMHYFEHLSTKEIGEQLGVSVKTVQNQLTKATSEIREKYKNYVLSLLIFGQNYFF